jgi:thiol-disulfide isomerase/thioredoxin
MRFVRNLAIVTIVVVSLSGLAAAQQAMSGFLPIDKFVFYLDGQEDPEAQVLQSQAAGAYLVMSTLTESPVLVQARSAAVMTVNLMKVDRQANGSVNLLTDSMLAPLGKFTIAGDGIKFGIDGRQAELRNKPWLLGEQDLDGMRGYSRDYRDGAAAYEFSEPLVRQLRAESRPVEVRVFFGSWCPHCQQVLPRVLRVAEELQGSQVGLSFYGLPQGDGFSADPEVKRFDIDSVPTAVVLVGGREVGRISGSGWKIPELAIKNAIQGS